MLGKPPLVLFLRERIESQGPLSFAEFMKWALYHPDFGYYTDPTTPRIGREGDFYTSVSLGALFGELLAQQFEEMWEVLDHPKNFLICEQGANDGRFAADVLQWLRQNRPELFAHLTYQVIEPFATNRARQKKLLRKQTC